MSELTQSALDADVQAARGIPKDYARPWYDEEPDTCNCGLIRWSLGILAVIVILAILA